MDRVLRFAIAGGLASALLQMSGVQGLAGSFLFTFAQLPLFLVGLSSGATAILIAGAVGTLATAVLAGPAGALIYVLVTAAGPLLLTRRALLARSTEQGTDWMPAGELLVWLAGIAAIYLVAAMLAFASSEGGLLGVLTVFLIEALGQLQGQFPDILNLDAGITLEDVANEIGPLIPAALLVWWMSLVIANGAIAQGILVRSGRNLRPSPHFESLTLPNWLAGALMASLVMSIMGGTPGFIGGTLAAMVLMVYFILGLAVVHAMSRAWNARGLALTGFYFVLVVFGWLMLLVAVLGLFEQWTGLRARQAARPPDREDS